jgi:hypothetical protein
MSIIKHFKDEDMYVYPQDKSKENLINKEDIKNINSKLEKIEEKIFLKLNKIEKELNSLYKELNSFKNEYSNNK